MLSSTATGEIPASTSIIEPLAAGTSAGVYSHLSPTCATSVTLHGLLAGVEPVPLLTVNESGFRRATFESPVVAAEFVPSPPIGNSGVMSASMMSRPSA